MRVKFVGISNHRVSRFLWKCFTVGANCQPFRKANTSIFICSVRTGDKHKSISANHFATIARAASLHWISLFLSSTHFTLRCLTARRITFRSSLFWDVTQRRLLLNYRRFGTTFVSHLQGTPVK